MKIGSCFSGVGAMDLAAERHFGGRTVWFCEQDQHCVKVLGRHWPGVPVYDDVRTLVADGAEPIDVLVGGPPCQDMSAAGRQAGLVDGERSSLFFDFVDVAAALKPRLVVVENVPALLSKWRGVVEDAFAAAGYGCTWARVAAQHVRGCPHKRLRVFILAERGGPHRGVCDAGALPAVGVGAWPTPRTITGGAESAARKQELGRTRSGGGDLQSAVMSASAWPTPTVPKGGAMTRSGERSDERLLNGAVQPQAWPTPAAQEPGIDAARLVDRDGNRPDTPMQRCFDKDTGRLAQTGLAQAVQAWPTPAAGLPNDGQDPATYRARLARLKAQHNNGNGAGVVLAQAVQGWTTPTARDHKDAGHNPHVSLDLLPRQVCAPSGSDANKGRLRAAAGTEASAQRLNPAWVEALQGLPPGWSDPTGSNELRWHAEHLMDMPRWPAPMVKGQWGDSPQHAWEPPRTVLERVAARSARLRALGNCNPPQQYLLAFALLERGPAQVSLFELMA